jgi:O2-independent ubiquinone biosynthesis accessory factor UbiT
MPDITPPFSPGLLAGILLRPVPDMVLNGLLSTACRQIRQLHPDLLDRLQADQTGIVVINITDLRISLSLSLSPDGPGLRLATPPDRHDAVAKINGALQALVDLMEGRVDGDALFFSRELQFEGDTEIVVALRNCLDGADIRITDLVPLPLFLSSLRPGITGGLARLHDAAWQDMELIRSAATARLERSGRQQAKKIARLESRLSELEKTSARSKRTAKA